MINLKGGACSWVRAPLRAQPKSPETFPAKYQTLENTAPDCKEYDTVKFQIGYSKDAPQMVVQCREIYIAPEGNVPEKDLQPENFFFVIQLGEILEKKNC